MHLKEDIYSFTANSMRMRHRNVKKTVCRQKKNEMIAETEMK